jgi:hypothetical protein
MNLEKEEKNVNLDKHLISKTRNSWNSILGLDQETQFSINLVLKDGIIKKNTNLKKISK